jgi:hypothetical protein
MWCKALARFSEVHVRNEVIPQQLGVGVAGGQELYVHGFNLKIEKATKDGWLSQSISRMLITLSIVS